MTKSIFSNVGALALAASLFISGAHGAAAQTSSSTASTTGSTASTTGTTASTTGNSTSTSSYGSYSGGTSIYIGPNTYYDPRTGRYVTVSVPANTPAKTVTPGLPNTGAGGDMAVNLAILAASGGIALASLRRIYAHHLR